MDEARSHAPPPAYRTTLDRAGLALATGSGLCGLVALLLGLAGDVRDPMQAMLLAGVGALLGAAIITLFALPAWFALHRLRRRRAWHAAALGATIALVVFVAAQTGGFTATLAFRWFSALATSALLAIVAAGIALAMWRVAYRPG